jgi:NitT/TauT family transport system permease protein
MTTLRAENLARSPAAPAAQADARSAAGRHRARMEGLGLAAGRVAILAGILLVWWAVVRFGWVEPVFIGTPSRAAAYLAENFWSEVLPNAGVTLGATLIAFVLSGICGVLGGLALWEFPYVKRLVDPFLSAFNSMPRIALAPLFVLWFGIGTASKVALAFSLGFFVVLLSTYAGIRNVDPVLLRLSRSLGCSGWQQFTKIMLPWAVPGVFAGLRLALIYSFLGVITSEMIASKRGLGQLIMYYSGVLRMESVIALLVVTAVMAVAITLVADRIEAKLLGNWTDAAPSARD